MLAALDAVETVSLDSRSSTFISVEMSSANNNKVDYGSVYFTSSRMNARNKHESATSLKRVR